jgi:hypothetical protein
VWFTGHYALYQGQLLDNKLGLILGARHDRFHSRDRIYDRFEETIGNPRSVPGGNELANNPDNRTFGFFPLPEGVTM